MSAIDRDKALEALEARRDQSPGFLINYAMNYAIEIINRLPSLGEEPAREEVTLEWREQISANSFVVVDSRQVNRLTRVVELSFLDTILNGAAIGQVELGPDISRHATDEDYVLAGELSTQWPLSRRIPQDALHLAIYVRDNLLTVRQVLTREMLDEMIEGTLNDLGAKYGYHMEQRVIRNVALREFRDALLDSEPSSEPLSRKSHYFAQESDEPVATCVHCGQTDDGEVTPNCSGGEPLSGECPTGHVAPNGQKWDDFEWFICEGGEDYEKWTATDDGIIYKFCPDCGAPLDDPKNTDSGGVSA